MSKKDVLYVGSDIPIRFDVTVDGKAIKPSTVTVTVYAPDQRYMFDKIFRPKKTEVFYKLQRKYVTETGQYVFDFSCRLPEYGMQRHIVRRNVSKSGVRDVLPV